MIRGIVDTLISSGSGMGRGIPPFIGGTEEIGGTHGRGIKPGTIWPPGERWGG